MTTATPSVRALPQPAQRPAAASGAGGVALDPIRLLRKYYPLLIGAAVVGAVLGAAAHFVLARVYPVYESSATFACFPASTNPLAVGGVGTSNEDVARFMGTQMAIMTSSTILEKVLQDAEVEQTQWASAYKRNGVFQPKLAQIDLEQDLKARIIPSSNLIRLSMRHKDPDDVRKIVDTATRVYTEYLSRTQTESSVEQRAVLNTQVNALDADIRNLTTARSNLLADNNITDINAGGATEDIRTDRINTEYVQTVSSLTARRSQLERFRKMREENTVVQYPDELREEVKRDPLIVGLDQQISNFRTDYSTLKAQGFGEEHPTVIVSRKRIDSAVKERDDMTEVVLRKLFDGRIAELTSAVDSLAASQAELIRELESVNKRKQDLTQLRTRYAQIEDDLKRKNTERAELDAARKSMEMLSSSQVFARVRLIGPAQRPNAMSFPQLKILVPLGVVLLAGLTGGIIVLREVLDQRVRGPADLGMIARLRILGMIPDAQEDSVKIGSLATAFADAPNSAMAESYRHLRGPIVKAMDQGGYKSLLVLSGMPGSGASSIVSNLAMACAGAEERVLIIDANLRRPTQHKTFGVADGPGLGDVLAGVGSLQSAAQQTKHKNIFVLTAGSAQNRNLPERLSSATMTRILNEATEVYDRVLIDVAPGIVSGDGFALANRAHCSLLVVRALQEKRGLVNRFRNQLSECRGEFLGVVVNAVRASAGGYLRGNIKVSQEYQSGSNAA